MIIWMKAGVDGRPNSQRAAVLQTNKDIGKSSVPQILVRTLGDSKLLVLEPKDIVGIEIDEHLTINFKSSGWGWKDNE